MSSIVVAGDTSGTITLDAPAVAGTTTLTLPTTNGTVLTNNSATVGSNGITFSDGSTQTAAASPFGLKNRIINGDMVINQRGATLSTTNSQGYFIDRMWGFSGASTAATFSQQSSSGLAGFPFFARAQRTAGNTGTTGVYFGQIIESNNLQDLQGQSVTVSFWARAGANYSAGSSVLTVFLRTGTVADQGLNATISPGWTGQVDQTSNVTLTTSWQRFSRTFTVASNVQEMTTFFYNATSGTAGAADFFDITGVQLERNTTATPFEWIPYGTELMLCQRYFQTISNFIGYGVSASATNGMVTANVSMRATPSFGLTGVYSISDYYALDHTQSSAAISLFSATSAGAAVGLTNLSGLTFGRVYLTRFLNSNQITMSAEL